jgi:hypothetical protein
VIQQGDNIQFSHDPIESIMDTFTEAKPFQPHADYAADRKRTLRELEREITRGSIDLPLLPMIRECMQIPHCFTVQCCCGHFVHDLEPDPENLSRPSQYAGTAESLRYRVAYLAVCIREDKRGRELFADLQALATQEPGYIQFGSADWFWNRMVNTYCIQLEPERMKELDSGMVSLSEARTLEEIRTVFFDSLAGIIRKHRSLLPEV